MYHAIGVLISSVVSEHCINGDGSLLEILDKDVFGRSFFSERSYLPD